MSPPRPATRLAWVRTPVETLRLGDTILVVTPTWVVVSRDEPSAPLVLGDHTLDGPHAYHPIARERWVDAEVVGLAERAPHLTRVSAVGWLGESLVVDLAHELCVWRMARHVDRALVDAERAVGLAALMLVGVAAD